MIEFELPPVGLNAEVAHDNDRKDSHLCPMVLALKFLPKEKGEEEGVIQHPLILLCM